MPLLLTFELYLHRVHPPPTFEALTCFDELELLAAMRARLADPEIVSIEAHRMGDHVATITR